MSSSNESQGVKGTHLRYRDLLKRQLQPTSAKDEGKKHASESEPEVIEPETEAEWIAEVKELEAQLIAATDRLEVQEAKPHMEAHVMKVKEQGRSSNPCRGGSLC